ncbi:MAG: Asp-tRNA(Asn)/Glu-tRNA(Gln) amidotransferase subunit GatB [Deltaproteobacteria bacterium]|nr:Asp-tRNA(Asn)/Glu-tRNA(Gln) amidotransferase subunit GatB [Deltaproteobacteria bacterium]
MSRNDQWETVIGLEVHAQLKTATKLFCSCSTRFGEAPNSNTCPVCSGYPGVLPVLNGSAVEYALRAALALGCEIPPMSRFARKNYFYPDLPKGYQISQYELPLAVHGHLEIPSGDGTKRVGITRVHMEEDAGKLVHAEGASSLVDLNRAGTPLVEIVSEPDIRSAAEAADYVRTLRSILTYAEVCDGNMAEGSLRCDANVSVRPRGSTTFGTRAEIKNMNSFKFIEKAINYEIERQIELIEDGGKVVQETRLFDSRTGRTESMRSKEEAHDYRYFPEPDLPPLVLTPARVAEVRASLPELPDARRKRFADDLGLPTYDARVLTETRELADYFEDVVKAGAAPKAASNWVMGEVLRGLKGEAPAPSDLKWPPRYVADLIAMVEAGTISGSVAKTVIAEGLESGQAPAEIVKAKGLSQISDDSALFAEVDAVIAANPGEVEKYRAGKEALLGFFVGQVMKRTGGKANPKRLNEIVRDKLKAP